MERSFAEIFDHHIDNPSTTLRRVRPANFESLGCWPGWSKGEFPPYWRRLTEEVFKRDDGKCQFCGQPACIEDRVAHHIQPKEEGGVDAIRNLTTLHDNPCHDIVHVLRDSGLQFDFRHIGFIVGRLRRKGIDVNWTNIGEIAFGIRKLNTLSLGGQTLIENQEPSLDQHESGWKEMNCRFCAEPMLAGSEALYVYHDDCEEKYRGLRKSWHESAIILAEQDLAAKLKEPTEIVTYINNGKTIFSRKGVRQESYYQRRLRYWETKLCLEHDLKVFGETRNHEEKPHQKTTKQRSTSFLLSVLVTRHALSDKSLPKSWNWVQRYEYWNKKVHEDYLSGRLTRQDLDQLSIG